MFKLISLTTLLAFSGLFQNNNSNDPIYGMEECKKVSAIKSKDGATLYNATST